MEQTNKLTNIPIRLYPVSDDVPHADEHQLMPCGSIDARQSSCARTSSGVLPLG